MENQKEANKVTQALQETVMNGIKLGYEIGKLQSGYGFKSIVEFIKGNIDTCYAFDTIKPLYDKYGYETTNKAILYIVEQYEIKTGDKTNE